MVPELPHEDNGVGVDGQAAGCWGDEEFEAGWDITGGDDGGFDVVGDDVGVHNIVVGGEFCEYGGGFGDIGAGGMAAGGGEGVFDVQVGCFAFGGGEEDAGGFFPKDLVHALRHVFRNGSEGLVCCFAVVGCLVSDFPESEFDSEGDVGIVWVAAGGVFGESVDAVVPAVPHCGVSGAGDAVFFVEVFVGGDGFFWGEADQAPALWEREFQGVQGGGVRDWCGGLQWGQGGDHTFYGSHTPGHVLLVVGLHFFGTPGGGHEVVDGGAY